MQKKTTIMFVMAFLLLVAIPIVSAWCFLGVGTTCEATSLAYNERTDWEDIKAITTSDVSTTCYNQKDSGTKHSIYCDRVASKDASFDFYSYFKIANTKNFKITEIRTIQKSTNFTNIEGYKEVTCAKESVNETKGLKCFEPIFKVTTYSWTETQEIPLSLSKDGTYDYKLDSKVSLYTSKVKTYKIEWEDEKPTIIQEVMQGTDKEGRLVFPAKNYYFNELKINPITSYNSTDNNWGGVASNTELDASNNITAKLIAGETSLQRVNPFWSNVTPDNWNRIEGGAFGSGNAWAFSFVLANPLNISSSTIFEIFGGETEDEYGDCDGFRVDIKQGATASAAYSNATYVSQCYTTAAAWKNNKVATGSYALNVSQCTGNKIIPAGAKIYTFLVANTPSACGFKTSGGTIGTAIASYHGADAEASRDPIAGFYSLTTSSATYKTSGNRTLDGFCPDYPKKYDWSNATLGSINTGANVGNMTIKFSNDNSTWIDETAYADLQMVKKNYACIQMIPNVTTTGGADTPRIFEAGITYKSTDAPELYVTNPENTTYNDRTLYINYTVIDNELDSVWYSINHTENITITQNTSVDFPLGNVLLMVYANDTEGNTNETNISFYTQDIVPPSFDTITYFPPTINVSLIFEQINGGRFHINSTVVDASGIDQAKTKLYYNLNASTLTGCWLSINGTNWSECPQPSLAPTVTINSTNYEWSLGENMLFEANLNAAHEDFDAITHTTRVADINSRHRIRFLQVPTSNINTMEFELMADNTSATAPPLQIFACNSTYTTGSPATSPNCLGVGAFINSETYNHIHTTNSKHRLLSMSVDNGKIDSILQLTSTMYFVATVNSGWELYSISNSTNSAATANNPISAWTQKTYTIDSHIHTTRTNEKFNFFVEACDNKGNCGNSTIYPLTETGADLPPTAPRLFTPTDFENISGYYNITFLNSTVFSSPEEGVNYTLRLFNAGTNIFNFTIVDNTTYTPEQSIHSYYWNSALATSGVYDMRIRATDGDGNFVVSEVLNVTIDNEAPSIPQLHLPENNTKVISLPNLNWSNSTHWLPKPIQYFLEVDDVPDFTSIDYEATIKETANTTGDTPTGLTLDTSYFWRVKASVNETLNSTYSETRAFNYSSFRPEIRDLRINTTDPTKNDTSVNIDCSFELISYKDGSDFIVVKGEWYEDGAYLREDTYTVANGTQGIVSLDKSLTTKGKMYSCMVYVPISLPTEDIPSYNITSDNVTIINSFPTIPLPLLPLNNTYSTSWYNELSWMNSSDIDGDEINYSLYWDEGTNPPTTLKQSNTSLSYQSTSTSNTISYWRVRAYDGENYSDYSNTMVYTVDNTTTRSNTTTQHQFIYEGDKAYFELNLTVNNMTIEDVTSNGFKINNTLHTLTRTKINDTDYRFSATVNAPVYTINNPDVKTWFFNVSYTRRDAIVETSKLFEGSSNISRVVFSVCNPTSSNYNKYINYTFKDETSGLYINGTLNTATFTYSLNSDMTGSKTLVFTNTSIIDSYPFCFEPYNRTAYTTTAIAYSNSPLYPQRNSAETLSLTNTTLNRTLYLASTSVGVYSTFVVTNIAYQFLSGANVYVERDFAGSWTYITSQNTDDAGSASFWLDPNYSHRITFTKSGYTTYVMTVNPTATSYSIVLGSSTTTQSYNFHNGINYAIEPNVLGLTNSTDYTFVFAVNSSYWELEGAGFTLRNKTATLGTATCTGTTSCTASLVYNTGNQSWIYMDYYWTITGNTTTQHTSWKVSESGAGASAMDNLMEDLTLLGASFGSDSDASFTKGFIAFLLILIITGIVTYISGLYSPMAIISEVFVLTLFFDLIGWIPQIAGGSSHIIPLIIGVAGLGYYIYETGRQ